MLGRDYHYVGKLVETLFGRIEAGCIDSVIVAQQNAGTLRTGLSRHSDRLLTVVPTSQAPFDCWQQVALSSILCSTCKSVTQELL